MADAKLEIIFDGEVPGLSHHRLSLAHFGKSLPALIATIRRIATNFATNAADPAEPRDRGRWTNIARQLDVEISGISRGSAGFESVLSFTPPLGEPPRLFNDIATAVAMEFLDSVESESKGILRNGTVRNFLRTLPSGLTKQTYRFVNGSVKREVVIGEMALDELPPELPHLAEIIGLIVGVGFEPGRSEVRIRQDDGHVQNLAATTAEVETAWNLRNISVKALYVDNGVSGRLLRLEDAQAPAFPTDQQSINKHIFEHWRDLLNRLAK